MAKTYRVAVIGRTGKGNYGHGLDVVWKELDNVEIVAVADPDEKGRAAAAKRLGAKNAYADYRTMLEKEKPQIVSVADPLARPAPRHGGRLRPGRREHLPRKADGPHACRGRRDDQGLRDAPRQAGHRSPDALQPARCSASAS